MGAEWWVKRLYTLSSCKSFVLSLGYLVIPLKYREKISLTI